jgi:hypothetical protein
MMTPRSRSTAPFKLVSLHGGSVLDWSEDVDGASSCLNDHVQPVLDSFALLCLCFPCARADRTIVEMVLHQYPPSVCALCHYAIVSI